MTYYPGSLAITSRWHDNFNPSFISREHGLRDSGRNLRILQILSADIPGNQFELFYPSLLLLLLLLRWTEEPGFMPGQLCYGLLWIWDSRTMSITFVIIPVIDNKIWPPGVVSGSNNETVIIITVYCITHYQHSPTKDANESSLWTSSSIMKSTSFFSFSRLWCSSSAPYFVTEESCLNTNYLKTSFFIYKALDLRGNCWTHVHVY